VGYQKNKRRRSTKTSSFGSSGRMNHDSSIAALKTDRSYCGYEINEEYVRLAERRVEEFGLDFNSPRIFDK